MKKFLQSILAIAISLVLITPSVANATTIINTTSQDSFEESVDPEVEKKIEEFLTQQGLTFKRLTFKEYEERNANKPRIKASNRVKRGTGDYIPYQIHNTESLVNSNGAYCELTYGCDVTVYASGSFVHFSEATNPYVLSSASGTVNWMRGKESVQLYKNGTQIVFRAAGVLEGKVSEELSVEFSAAGFITTSGSATLERYVRKFHEIYHIFGPR